ncbi:MAG: hypothetical protein K8R92_09115 [Planctomycetes bacterium]|nr:hypothetical protein [Planctomycetota bacterium]
MSTPKSKSHVLHTLYNRKFLFHFVLVIAMVLVSLLLGMAGYMYFENLPWRDAYLNSAMLLGGMGPIDSPKTDGGKLFAGSYALYAGLVILLSLAILIAPVVHKVMTTLGSKP